jgi:colanic acid biosynthesis glycosyl transferase WcaI
MRILLITQTYPPEPEKLLGELAETLLGFGHEVTVLTAFPNYPEGKIYPGYRLKHWQREKVHGVSVIRFPLYPDHGRGAAGRIMNFGSFAASVATLAPFVAPKADVIHVVDPPFMATTALWLSRLKRIPFTCEIQDIWPETLRATGMVSNKRVLDLIAGHVKWYYRNASAIRVITPGFRQNLIGKGVDGSKIHVIQNWVDSDFYRPIERDEAAAESLRLAGRFNVVYAGTMGLAQGLDTVLEAARLLSDLPLVQFVFVGYGNDTERLKQIVKQYNLNNVIFHSRRPESDMPGLFALADVLLIHLRDDPLFRITIPHKVYTYLSSGKPILAALEGDAAEVVKSARAGLACPSGNPAALADAVRALFAMPADDREAMGHNGRRAACGIYDREQLVGRVSGMLEAVVRANKHRYNNKKEI